jgi:hypothetical protein
MTTKQILFLTFIFGAINNIASGMDNTNNNHHSEAAIFQANLNKLKYHAASFVLHFQTWTKEEQDKVSIYNSNVYHGYVTSSKPKASPLFDNSVVLYLDHHVKKEELIQFLDAMEYLKKQK